MVAQITRSDIENLDIVEPDVPRDVFHGFKRVPVDMFDKERSLNMASTKPTRQTMTKSALLTTTCYAIEFKKTLTHWRDSSKRLTEATICKLAC